MIKQLIFITISLLFLACSSSGTSVEPEPLKTLYFIDSAVNGVDFKCGNRVGVTETKEINGTLKSGVLQCRKDTITFSLGKLILGSIESYKDGQEIRPQDLVHVPQDQIENEGVVKMALLLQSLNKNKSDINITITDKIKKKLTITSLTNLSITEIEELIVKLGKTPIELNEVKKHLIRNSSISYEDSKPTISPFEVEISTSSPAGFVIGKVNINEGKSPLISLILSGDGANHFQLNSDGTLKLLKNIPIKGTYNLIIKAENIYGSYQSTVNIIITQKGKYANVYLDANIVNATVKIIKLHYSGNNTLIHTTKTNSQGNFDLNIDLLEEEDYRYYLYEVSGGEYLDKTTNTNVVNKSILRLITNKTWIKNATQQIRITALSEIAYDYSAIYVLNKVDSLSFNHNKNELPSILLKTDLNNDGQIDMQDIMIFNPQYNKKDLYRTLAKEDIFSLIITQLKDGDKYIETLFKSHILKEFNGADSFKQVGSFVYYFTPKNGIFYIYDLDNNQIISQLFISIPDFSLNEINNEELFHTNLAVDIQNNKLYIGNLNEEIYIIDIQNLTSPSILYHFKIGVTNQIEIKDNNILWINTPSYLTTENKDYDWVEDFFDSLENNTTFGTELEEQDSKFLVYDCSNPLKPNFKRELPYFDKIRKDYAYIIKDKDCTNTSTITVIKYRLTDLIKSDYDLRNYETKYNIPSSCRERIYLDAKLYMYDYSYENGQSFQSYDLIEVFVPYIDLTYLNRYISKILDVNDQKGLVYTYDNNNIVILDTTKRNLSYQDIIPYKKNIDNLNLKFKNNFMITPQKIIDFPTFKFSAIYTQLSDNIDYSLFEKYSEN